ncbi:hypothetical protein [Amaricoccus sp. W119]|uniref:hypothetical protein n=1 Tax=Amaricoccus sp. W119 TaxID=3391833 RepID=UPI0039A5A06E
MTLANTNTVSTRANPIVRAGAWLVEALVRMGERSNLAECAELAVRLQRMTDKELARIGIDRAGIIPFAFRGHTTF